jgi:membrane protein implicated in regulation of membrane protease activity
MKGGNRLLLIITAATGVVVIAVAGFVIQSWAVLGIALAIHLIASAVVIYYSMKKIDDTGDKPDPVTQARIEDERAT